MLWLWFRLRLVSGVATAVSAVSVTPSVQWPLDPARRVPSQSAEDSQAGKARRIGMGMDQVALEAALHDAEQRLQAAVRAGDAQELDRLLDDRVIYTGPDGSTMTKEEDLGAHRSRALAVEVFDQQDLHVTVVDSTGITRVLARLEGTAGGHPFKARLRYTRTWIHADGSWRVLAAHASAVPDLG
ncbi:nuclear transport factor 2 family protein [Actinacidiphila yanglinensis]|nr:nuclear transport factor 2 family protein [Actinacidiphila yanglinensis]